MKNAALESVGKSNPSAELGTLKSVIIGIVCWCVGWEDEMAKLFCRGRFCRRLFKYK